MKTGNQKIKNFEGRDYRIPRTCGGELFCALSDWFSFILPSLLYASLLSKYHIKYGLKMICYVAHESALMVINMKIGSSVMTSVAVTVDITFFRFVNTLRLISTAT